MPRCVAQSTALFCRCCCCCGYLFVPLPYCSIGEWNQPGKHMLQHILPDLITKSFCRWVLGALSATMKIHLQMSIHYNGLIVSGRTAGRPDWDRGGWQPACMANKLTRDPCDNEWLQRRVSVCMCACVGPADLLPPHSPGQGNTGAATTLSSFCFSPLEAVSETEIRVLFETETMQKC